MGVRNIVLVMPVPEVHDDVLHYVEKANKYGWNTTGIQIKRTDYDSMMQGVIQSMKNIAKACSVCSVVDPADALCNEKICQTTFAMNATYYPFYMDNNHLTDYGIRKILNIYRSHSKNA